MKMENHRAGLINFSLFASETNAYKVSNKNIYSVEYIRKVKNETRSLFIVLFVPAPLPIRSDAARHAVFILIEFAIESV